MPARGGRGPGGPGGPGAGAVRVPGDPTDGAGCVRGCAVNALELAVLARRLRVAVIHGDGLARQPSGEIRSLLGEAASAIEDLVSERELLAEIWNSELPALDGPCIYCDGSGCLDCEGLGVLPTKIGVQILCFLDRVGWWRPRRHGSEQPEVLGPEFIARRTENG